MAMAAVVLGHLPFALGALPFVPLPAAEALPYLLGGIALHVGYQFFLLGSYSSGDLTQVYPIARGSAPLIVAAVSITVLGVQMTSMELSAVFLIGAGIISLTLVRRADGQRNGKAAALALATGCFIASYSLVDGLGARLAGTSLGFYAWLSIGNGIIMTMFLALRAPGTFGRMLSGGEEGFPRRGRCILCGICDGHLGLHPGADCAGDGIAGDQHRLRTVDRGLLSEGEAGSDEGDLDHDDAGRRCPAAFRTALSVCHTKPLSGHLTPRADAVTTLPCFQISSTS